MDNNNIGNICIGSDHRGFHLKEKLIEQLNKSNYPYKDLGCFNEENCDYPDIIDQLVSKLEVFGILICNTGVGMSIGANRHKSIRAALCFNTEITYLSRLHNDSNVLVLPAGYISLPDAIRNLEIFISTKFDGSDRYKSRIKKIS